MSLEENQSYPGDDNKETAEMSDYENLTNIGYR